MSKSFAGSNLESGAIFVAISTSNYVPLLRTIQLGHHVLQLPVLVLKLLQLSGIPAFQPYFAFSRW
jgi:hypothetical protein